MLVTVFLSVLILALALGNIFLSVTVPGSSAGRILRNSSRLDDFEMAADKERLRMLNKRIDRLESLLLKINNAKFVAKKLNGTNLVQKLNGFDEFKQNTRLEIEALKQQIGANKKGGNRRRKASKQEGIGSAKMHDLIYHSGKP